MDKSGDKYMFFYVQAVKEMFANGDFNHRYNPEKEALEMIFNKLEEIKKEERK